MLNALQLHHTWSALQADYCWECFPGSDLVHLVDSDGQLSDTERAHQQGVLPGLTAGLEARLKLPTAGVHHQHGHVSLHRGQEREFISSVQSIVFIIIMWLVLLMI